MTTRSPTKALHGHFDSIRGVPLPPDAGVREAAEAAADHVRNHVNDLVTPHCQRLARHGLEDEAMFWGELSWKFDSAAHDMEAARRLILAGQPSRAATLLGAVLTGWGMPPDEPPAATGHG